MYFVRCVDTTLPQDAIQLFPAKVLDELMWRTLLSQCQIVTMPQGKGVICGHFQQDIQFIW